MNRFCGTTIYLKYPRSSRHPYHGNNAKNSLSAGSDEPKLQRLPLGTSGLMVAMPR